MLIKQIIKEIYYNKLKIKTIQIDQIVKIKIDNILAKVLKEIIYFTMIKIQIM